MSTELSTGVYLLFLERALVYVGRSRNCRARIDGHRTNGRPFDSYVIAPCDLQSAKWVERAIIAATEPVQNRVLYRTGAERPEKPAPARLGAAEHPLMVLNKTGARARAKAFGLAREFDGAVERGELAFRRKNPAALKSTQRTITLGEVISWCERVQTAKLAA